MADRLRYKICPIVCFFFPAFIFILVNHQTGFLDDSVAFFVPFLFLAVAMTVALVVRRLAFRNDLSTFVDPQSLSTHSRLISTTSSSSYGSLPESDHGAIQA
eukprot:GFYU01012222.1.p1 GENE.GFYU01012222.1~~GFYU01012222.1.p1  ORF type:complete len:102 (+),score=10.00 GFYU01012222.1:164-469(+)